MKCKRWLKKAVMSLLLALAMTVGAFTGIIPGMIIESRAEAWPVISGSVYKITRGGTYTCPNSLGNQVQISGGTQNDPVIIKIYGAVTATTSDPSFPVFRIDGGYTQFVGSNEAKITTGNSAFGFTQHSDSFRSLSIRDVIIDGGNTSSGSGRYNILNIQPPVGGSTLSLENVKVKNWISTNTSVGGAVFLNNVTATLTNCEFDNLKAPNVGALIAADNSSVTLNGCSFKNCIAAGGGSANGGGALRVNKSASLTVNNCTFSGCKSLGSGINRGVVYVRNGGTLTLKGSTTITGNTAHGGNVYLPNGAKIKVDGFTGKAGVTMESPGVFTTGYNSNTEPSTYFISDNTNYAVTLTTGKEAKLVQAFSVSFNANGHGTAPDTQRVASGSYATEPTAPTANGFIFNGWYKEAACTNPWDFSSNTVTTATTLYAKWTVAYQVTYRVVNGTWSDDTMADKTETVQSGSTPASVPTGMKAASGYTGGAWNTNPTGATITGATTFTYTFAAKSKETTPTAAFTATGADTGTLSGVADGMKYSLDGGTTWTDIAGSTDINLTGLSAGTIQVVKKGNETTTVDSDPQTITVSKAETPNLTVTQPTVIDGKGTVATTTAHEYSSDNGSTWTACTANQEFAAGTYLIRVKVSGTALASGNQSVTITAFVPGKETTPSATFTATGADTGTLASVANGMKYSLDGTNWTDITGSDNIDLTGLSAGTIQVVKKGNGTTTVDSDPQTITVTKAETPNLTVTQPTEIVGKGTVATTTAHEYSSDNGSSWTACTANQEFEAGTYLIRVKASGTALASGNQSVTIAEATGAYSIKSTQGTEHILGEDTNTIYTVTNSADDKRAFERFTGVSVDGKAVFERNYTKASGSLVLTLKSAYLNTLAAGEHTVKISFTDGEVSTSLKILKAAETATPQPTATPTPRPVPKTGDASMPFLWLALILTGILGIGTLTVVKRRK